MKKFAITFLIILGFISFSLAQNKGEFEFDKEVHDFGTFSMPNVTHDFVFKNVGKAPILITDVKASCGCTTPEWPKTPILPGKKATIKVSYEAKSRPGKFMKTITITSNSGTPTKVLTISGVAVPSETSIEEVYPVEMGCLRFKTGHVSFDVLKSTDIREKTFEITNTCNNLVTVTFADVPEYITIKAVPATLKKGDKAIISVKFDATKCKKNGFVSDMITVKTSDKNQPKQKLAVSVTTE